jgi:hypothetical protein
MSQKCQNKIFLRKGEWIQFEYICFNEIPLMIRRHQLEMSNQYLYILEILNQNIYNSIGSLFSLHNCFDRLYIHMLPKLMISSKFWLFLSHNSDFSNFINWLNYLAHSLFIINVSDHSFEVFATNYSLDKISNPVWNEKEKR